MSILYSFHREREREREDIMFNGKLFYFRQVTVMYQVCAQIALQVNLKPRASSLEHEEGERRKERISIHDTAHSERGREERCTAGNYCSCSWSPVFYLLFFAPNSLILLSLSRALHCEMVWVINRRRCNEIHGKREKWEEEEKHHPRTSQEVVKLLAHSVIERWRWILTSLAHRKESQLYHANFLEMWKCFIHATHTLVKQVFLL